MNEKDYLSLLNDIDDDLIENAAKEHTIKKFPYKKIIVSAACIGICAISALLINGRLNGKEFKSEMAVNEDGYYSEEIETAEGEGVDENKPEKRSFFDFFKRSDKTEDKLKNESAQESFDFEGTVATTTSEESTGEFVPTTVANASVSYGYNPEKEHFATTTAVPDAYKDSQKNTTTKKNSEFVVTTTVVTSGKQTDKSKKEVNTTVKPANNDVCKTYPNESAKTTTIKYSQPKRIVQGNKIIDVFTVEKYENFNLLLKCKSDNSLYTGSIADFSGNYLMNYEVGDLVTVEFDSNIAETYPAQIKILEIYPTVYN